MNPFESRRLGRLDRLPGKEWPYARPKTLHAGNRNWSSHRLQSTDIEVQARALLWPYSSVRLVRRRSRRRLHPCQRRGSAKGPPRVAFEPLPCIGPTLRGKPFQMACNQITPNCAVHQTAPQYGSGNRAASAVYQRDQTRPAPALRCILPQRRLTQDIRSRRQTQAAKSIQPKQLEANPRFHITAPSDP